MLKALGEIPRGLFFFSDVLSQLLILGVGRVYFEILIDICKYIPNICKLGLTRNSGGGTITLA